MGEQTLWRHKKTGALYHRLALAVLESDRDTIMAVYETFDIADPDGEAQERWARPAREFYERFEQYSPTPAPVKED